MRYTKEQAIQRYAPFLWVMAANKHAIATGASPRPFPGNLVPLSEEENSFLTSIFAAVPLDAIRTDADLAIANFYDFYGRDIDRFMTNVEAGIVPHSVLVFDPEIRVNPRLLRDHRMLDPAATATAAAADTVTTPLLDPAAAAATAAADAAHVGEEEAAARAAVTKRKADEARAAIQATTVRSKAFDAKADVPEAKKYSRREKFLFILMGMFAIAGTALLVVAALGLIVPIFLVISAIFLGVAAIGLAARYMWARGKRTSPSDATGFVAKARESMLKPLKMIWGLGLAPVVIALAVFTLPTLGTVIGGAGIGAMGGAISAGFLAMGAGLSHLLIVLGMSAVAATAVTPVGWAIIAVVALVALGVLISVVTPMIYNYFNDRKNKSLPASTRAHLNAEGSGKLINTAEAALKQTVAALKTWRKSTDPRAAEEIKRLKGIIAKIRNTEKDSGAMQTKLHEGLAEYNAWRANPGRLPEGTEIAGTGEPATDKEVGMELASRSTASAARSTAAAVPTAAPVATAAASPRAAAAAPPLAGATMVDMTSRGSVVGASTSASSAASVSTGAPGGGAAARLPLGREPAIAHAAPPAGGGAAAVPSLAMGSSTPPRSTGERREGRTSSDGVRPT